MHRTLTAVIMGCLALLSLAGSSQAANGATPPYAIKAVTAYLYYNLTNDFSENVIDNKKFTLWNTVIGEGSAKGPSNATLVMVKVQGEPGSYAADRKVELTATAGGKTILKRETGISVLGQSGVSTCAFWLYDTGCVSVTLSARITGQSKPSAMKKTIDFHCGE